MTDERIATRERYVERLLAEASDLNRPMLAKYLRAKRASGLKPSSLMNIAVGLSRLDQHSAGTRIEELSPDALTSILEQFTRTHQPRSVDLFATQIRTFYRWLHLDDLPKEYRFALKRQHKHIMADIEVVAEPEFASLLEAFNDGPQRGTIAKRQALAWVLWDSGFRISEALSLQVGDFRPDDRGGANLRLRPSAPNLKTGPRTIYVVDCVPAIRVWLEFHPDFGNPKAPLFPSHRNASNSMWPNNVSAMLKLYCEKAGIRALNPHLFRHTRATRAAAIGWNEPQMRAYFGWSSSSDMPAHYIHLSQRNMEDRVRKDAGIDESGQHIRGVIKDDDLDRVLRKRLKKLLLEDD